MFRQRRLLLLAFAACLSLPATAQPYGSAAGSEAGSTPLNLSLPRNTVRPTNAGTGPDTAANAPAEATKRDSKAEAGNDLTDCPYGTGFEARQRRLGRRWQGGNAGRGTFGGGGGGGGRGRGRGR